MSGEIPILAVLPFAVMTSDDREAILARGLAEDVAGELTRFADLEVVSPVSSAAVARLPDREAGQRLGVSHLLRGTLGHRNKRLRVVANLVDCTRGTQLWSEQIDVEETSFPDVSETVAGRIAATLAARLEHDVLRESRRKPKESLAAYELTLRGMALLREGTVAADEKARQFFDRALEIDPDYARAHAGISLSWFNEYTCQFWRHMEENGRRAYIHGHRALDLDDRDALLHVVVGKVLLFRCEFDRASWYFDRALALCPNDAEMLIQLAVPQVYLGQPELGAELADRALRLNPFHPNYYFGYAALAHAAARNFERALEIAGFGDQMPIVDVPAYLAAANAYLGQIQEGRAQLENYTRMYQERIAFGREPETGEACRWLLDVNPYRRPEDRRLLCEGFRLLGEGGEAHPPQPSLAATTDHENALLRQGEGWLALFAGRRAVLPDLKGLHDIRRLLSLPGEPLHCLDLAERAGDLFTGDEVLDEKARGLLAERIRSLQEDLDEAETMGDIGRAEKARSEMDALIEQLGRALGLGGRGRRLGDAAERARTTVTWRIRHAIKRIRPAHPELARHLANSLRTGTFCSYEPEQSPSWRLDEVGKDAFPLF
jgi:TolB-like protein/Tfp pilus assembly protein PilF